MDLLNHDKVRSEYLLFRERQAKREKEDAEMNAKKKAEELAEFEQQKRNENSAIFDTLLKLGATGCMKDVIFLHTGPRTKEDNDARISLLTSRGFQAEIGKSNELITNSDGFVFWCFGKYLAPPRYIKISTKEDQTSALKNSNYLIVRNTWTA